MTNRAVLHLEAVNDRPLSQPPWGSRSLTVIAPASRKLGKYEILQKLGRGGMADVYLAQDTASGHTVALKLIEHALDADTRDSIEAERRGAVLQAHLAAVDPRVGRVFESGDLDGFFYVAMEYIDGQDLSELMRHGKLSTGFAVDVAIAVAETLDHAHTLCVTIEGKECHGIIHGDIKPKNIRIDSRGEVRVLDFGIAKALSLSRRLTRNEFGSVPYGSPERLEAGQVNEQSDLWSLAVMLYEMVTGLQPYLADTTERLERMIRSRIPPPPAPDPCPEPLRRILMKAMAPDPFVRYQNATEFRDDLAAFQSGGSVRAAQEDLDATRRTYRPSEALTDETRRTGGLDDERDGDGGETRRTTPAPEQNIKWPPRRKSSPLWLRRAVAGSVLFFCGFLVWIAAADVLLYRHGAQLEQQIATEQVTDPNEIWNKWNQISDGNASSWLLRGPRKLVKQHLVASAVRTIDSYRNGDAVYESSWKSAHDFLGRALALDPDDTVRGQLRLVEGHLARINASAHHSVAEWNDAIEKFNEAQRLMPQSPDPQLGLARVYVYGLKDIDKAYEALQLAEQHGYKLGNREKSQLADGYRDRADRLFWDSRNVRGLPQEKDQIQRAKDDYNRALELYKAITPWGGASAQITRVQQSLVSVNTRLQELEAPNNPPGGNPGPAASHSSVPRWVGNLLREIWKSRQNAHNAQ